MKLFSSMRVCYARPIEKYTSLDLTEAICSAGLQPLTPVNELMSLEGESACGEGKNLVTKAELIHAVTRLDAVLRSLPFCESECLIAGRKLQLLHPLDIEGAIDTDYLVVYFETDLPPYWLHRSVPTVDSYIGDLGRNNVTSYPVLYWVTSIAQASHSAMGRRRAKPIILVFVHHLVNLLQPILIIIATVLHWRDGGGRARLRERFGYTCINRPTGPLVWLHASSIGEVKQLSGIIRKLLATADTTILVTTTTSSSAKWVSKEFPTVLHQFVPIDTPVAVGRFLANWKPDALVIAENEIWPEMIETAAEAGLLMVQTGARPSRTRSAFPQAVSHLLNFFSTITCITDKVRYDLLSAGVAPHRIVMCPDIRKSNARQPIDQAALLELRRAVDNRKVWIAASTHDSDLSAVLDAHIGVQAEIDALLIVVPRHPRDSIKWLRGCASRGLNMSRRSTSDPVRADTHVYLADTFGELGTFFAAGSVVYLGGGLGGEGGHNPYEPASHGCMILSGPKVDNFDHAFVDLARNNAVKFVLSAADLQREAIHALHQEGPVNAADQRISEEETDALPSDEIILAEWSAMLQARNRGMSY